LRYGLTTWLWPKAENATPSFPLLSILMDASSVIHDFQVNMFLGDGQYRRVNPTIKENISLDDCSKIPYMQKLVDNYIKSEHWQHHKNWIQENFL
ncbi:MAG: hypothetical protein AAFW70_28570, partial [Cyanobacteria bacterium J06635_10]